MPDSYTMDEYFETRDRNRILVKALSTLGGKKMIRLSPAERKERLKLGLLDGIGCRRLCYHTIVDDPGREEKVIRMRFGMSPYSRSHTSKEIAEELDVTYSRAREIEFKSLRKLRNLPNIGILKIFLENN